MIIFECLFYLDLLSKFLAGTGKTHLATALGIEAATHRKSVYFISSQDLMIQLKKAENENHLDQRLRAFTRYKLLIIDEIRIYKSR